MVYGVFCGCYSDWQVIGYFNNRLDADKYCAAYGGGDFYVKEIEDLQNEKDLSKISLKYEHEVIFDFNNNNDNEWIMRDEPTRYKCYISDELNPNRIEHNLGVAWGWICFCINIDKDNRKLAEKIAQDYFYQLLVDGNDIKLIKNFIKSMNDKFAEPYKIKEELKRQEELKQKELAELARLKAKYESNV